jgi:hypothetical protein
VNLYVASVDNFASPVSLTFSAPPGVTASFNGQARSRHQPAAPAPPR